MVQFLLANFFPLEPTGQPVFRFVCKVDDSGLGIPSYAEECHKSPMRPSIAGEEGEVETCIVRFHILHLDDLDV